MKALLEPLGVACVDAMKVRRQFPARTLNGWELKPYAMINSRFREVLLLDADNVPVRDPAYLFDAPQYRACGAVFWPDYGQVAREDAAWEICGVEYRDEPAFESGQILIDKAQCWHPLQVTMYLNEHSDYYYRHLYGDKDTFHMAWRRLGRPYAMPSRRIKTLDGTMCQHDFDGRRVFQHRNTKKWVLGTNPKVPGFEREADCLRFLDELRSKWLPPGVARLSETERDVYDRVVRQRHYLYVRVGHDWRPMELLENLDVGRGAAGMERRWGLRAEGGAIRLVLEGDHDGATCELDLASDGTFGGHWAKYERMPIILCPVRPRSE
jgi:hypothetical protein